MNDRLVELIRNCLAIDQMGVRAYSIFSRTNSLVNLAPLFAQMAEDEKEHVRCWRNILPLAESGAIPVMIDNPGKVLTYTIFCRETLEKEIDALPDIVSPYDALILAYRLEMTMLNPAFETFFSYFAILEPEKAIDYDTHLHRFIEVLAEPNREQELRLFAETIGILWAETQELARKNHFDALTGVLNRAGMLRAMESSAFLAQRTGSHAAVLMIDVDHFKRINDTHGHKTGDEVLIRIASVLQGAVRKSDLLGRLGGEEFAAFLCPVEETEILHIAEKLRKAVEKSGVGSISATVSIGGASSGIDSTPQTILAKLLREADQRLYIAKNKGRNRCIVEG